MIPSRRTLWTLARLLSGLPVEADRIAALPPPFDRIGARLAGLDLADRRSRWEASADALEDGDALVKAVDDEDPEGPEPADEPDEGEPTHDWPPIRLGTIPPAVPFPLDVLPLPVRDFVEAVARSIPCPVDLPAAAVLAATSAVIGRSACLSVREEHEESACLWLAIVAGPSVGKTPALKHAFKPIRRITRELYRDWREEMDRYQKAQKDGGAGDEEEPKLRRITTTDPTTEALGLILVDNPRGMAVQPDELARWLGGMNQYKGGKGSDRSFYLSVWSGAETITDRAKNKKEPIVVPDPYLAVIGGIPPDMLSELAEAKGREDGFVARFMFAYPESIWRIYCREGVPKDVACDWDRIVRSLWGRPMDGPPDDPSPWVVRMTPAADGLWEQWNQAHMDEQNAGRIPASLEGSWGKLQAYAARIALVLHLLDLASDPTRPAPDEPPALPHRIVADAVRLLAYFKAHTRRVFAAAGTKAGGGNPDAMDLLGWIGRGGRGRFSYNEVDHNYKKRFKDDRASLDDAIAWLIGCGLVRDIEAPAPGKVGRPRSRTLDVNPEFFSSPRFARFRLGPGEVSEVPEEKEEDGRWAPGMGPGVSEVPEEKEGERSDRYPGDGEMPGRAAG